ncbi:hypothetical protein [Methylocella sp.]|uniref:hypothetical protein n=1 Tax=Methylocella sp. TaxID=1978226 RepID=UPI0037832BC5
MMKIAERGALPPGSIPEDRAYPIKYRASARDPMALDAQAEGHGSAKAGDATVEAKLARGRGRSA